MSKHVASFILFFGNIFLEFVNFITVPRVMNLTNMKVSSKTVILSPYIFPVLAEMKICQFMFWHDMGCVTTVLISTALPLTYINCVFGGMANPTSASPLLPPFHQHSTC